MAGYNTRFHDAGFDVPKYLLPWKDGVIVTGILEGLGGRDSFSRILLLPNQRDRYFRKDLLAAVEKLGVTDADIVYIPDTRGQAHTAAIAAQMLQGADKAAGEPIAFHNADTVLLGRDMGAVATALATRDAYVDVFPASSAAYSYVALHEGRVSRIREKQVISPFASSGFYGFRNVDVYLAAFERNAAAREADDPRETYIADVLQTMIDNRADIFVNDFQQSAETIVLGKPEEYGLELARQSLMR